MESRAVDSLPHGPEWQFEPKWDGFRCLAFRDGSRVTLQSKSGQSLTRYFPEVVETIRKVKHQRFVIDGEIVIPVDGRLSFDDLLQRIHPAASRVQRLALETPATFIVFDLLVDQHGQSLLKLPLAERRHRLERFAKRLPLTGLTLSAATTNRRKAEGWFRAAGRGMLDGVIAKRLDDPYLSGERAMLKIKPMRTADCVVGGFRYGTHGKEVGSLLLGLFDRNGLLNHVGFTSSLTATQRQQLAPKLKALIRPPGFTGRAPGGPSRWSTKRSSEWQPLAHGLVVEVQYDHFSDGRFRHGTKFLRWRPDKSPKQCTFEQVERRHRKTWKSLIV
jgi:ATP-dependent DNA ligase